MHRIFKIVIPIFSIGLYLSFASFNSIYVSTQEILLWSLFALGLGVIVMLATWRMKPMENQLVLGFIILLWFYSWGYICKLCGFSPVIEYVDYWLIYIIGTAIVVVVGIMLHYKKIARSWRFPLCALSIGMLVFPLANVKYSNTVDLKTEDIDGRTLEKSVYVLVFDRYCRADMLEKYFDYDNSPFLDALNARGFEVADESMCNYAQTAPSTASMMNMNYLDALFPDATEDTQSYVPINKAFTNNIIKQAVGDQWYKIDSWFRGTQDSSYFLSEFAVNLLYSTALQPAFYYYDEWQQGKYNKGDTVEDAGGGLILYTQEWAAYLVHYQFGLLDKASNPQEPIFLFAHIISPHPPYVFDKNGKSPDLNQSLESLYIGQLQYINKLILEWVDGVIASNPEAVIVLMSDEGMKFADSAYGNIKASKTLTKEEGIEIHSANLMAVRNLDIYPTITPINVMRIMSNECLGTNLEMLEDKSFIIPDSNFPFRWVRVN